MARDSWLPGVVHGCYTLPRAGGITMLNTDAQGRCYGLLDDSGTGVFTPEAFGIDPVTRGLQRELLDNNRSVRDGDLTVVWLGSLSCDTAPSDANRCADGRDYPAERDQLRGLLFAQTQLTAVDVGHRLHVVIGDAAQDVRHIEDVARMIIARKGSLGRVAVVGGGDSRDSTQRAINRLLDAGIPFLAPNLLADLGAPGRPFVDRPGYLQLGAPNMDFATDLAARLTRRFPDGFRLEIFQHPDPTDASGPACADLSPDAYGNLTAQARASAALLKLPAGFACADRAEAGSEGELLHACTLDAAAKQASRPCAANDLGSFLVPAYDAVMLADELLKPGVGLNDLNLSSFTLATGTIATVRGGRLLTPTIAVRMWHADPLYDPARIWQRPSTGLRDPGRGDPVQGAGS